MARRLGHAHSQYKTRFRQIRPQVLQLEGRLAPGNVLDFFGVTATDFGSNLQPSLTNDDLGHHGVPVLSLVPTSGLNSGVPHIGSQETHGSVSQRRIARTQETSAPSGNPIGDPLSTTAIFATNLSDDAGSTWMSAANQTQRPAATLSRPGQSSKLVTGLGDDGFDSAPLNRAAPRGNNQISVTPEMISVPAASAGIVSQQDSEDRGVPRVLPGYRVDNPNQTLVPYSLTYTGTRDTPTTGVVKSPTEYDPMRGVIFSYTSFSSIVNDMVKELTEDPTKDDIAYVVVSSAGQQTTATNNFIAAGANMSKVQFFIQPSDSVWIRDYGPHFITVDDAPAIVDSHYYPNRDTDNYMPTRLGDSNFKVPTYDMGLYYSGGNFQPGPNNTGFVTSLVNYHNTATDGYNAGLISELYNKYQGIDTLHVMPQLPFSVDGTGHIDMWMYLVDADTVVISEFIPGSNATATQITNDAVTYMQNLGFNVHRPKAWNVGSTHYTYANAFRVNNRIFVPVYGTLLKPGGNSSYNDEDADAMAKWQAAAGPGVEIIPIQSSSIIPSAGAVHCIVMQVPRYTGTAPAGNVISPAAGDILLKGSQHKIEWSAMDTNNTDPASVDIYVSFTNGVKYRHLATTADTGSYTWTVFGRTVSNATIKIVITSSDSDVTTIYSQPFTITAGTANKYDFATGAGVNKFGWGSNTAGWSNINNQVAPVGTALSAGNYTAMSTSNATGGDTDANRYIAPVPSVNNESTHTFSFNLSEAIVDMDEIEIRWEGYADYTTHVELYVWDTVAGNWGDGTGLTGNNRYMDDWAGAADGDLVGYVRSDFSRYVDGTGTIRFLVYSDRTGTNPDTQHNTGIGIETFHDYVSVTVKQV